jgi:hypothetical protein
MEKLWGKDILSNIIVSVSCIFIFFDCFLYFAVVHSKANYGILIGAVAPRCPIRALASGRSCLLCPPACTPTPASHGGLRRSVSVHALIHVGAVSRSAARAPPLPHVCTGPATASRWLWQVGPTTICVRPYLLLQHLDKTFATHV